MVEIRFHGRGGQGAVTAAEVLAVAAFKGGKEAQAFPNFGVERRGAPVVAYARIADEFIKTREQINTPEWVVVQDDTLLDIESIYEGTDQDTKWVINTTKDKEELKKLVKSGDVWTVSATKIAVEILGKPIVNTAVLGALIKASDLVPLDSMLEVIGERFPGEMGEKNKEAIQRAYKETV